MAMLLVARVQLWLTGADFEGGAPQRALSIFYRDRAPDFV